MDGFVTYDAKYRSTRGDVAGLLVLKLFTRSSCTCRQRSAPGSLPDPELLVKPIPVKRHTDRHTGKTA